MDSRSASPASPQKCTSHPHLPVIPMSIKLPTLFAPTFFSSIHRPFLVANRQSSSLMPTHAIFGLIRSGQRTQVRFSPAGNTCARGFVPKPVIRLKPSRPTMAQNLLTTASTTSITFKESRTASLSLMHMNRTVLSKGQTELLQTGFAPISLVQVFLGASGSMLFSASSIVETVSRNPDLPPVAPMRLSSVPFLPLRTSFPSVLRSWLMSTQRNASISLMRERSKGR